MIFSLELPEKVMLFANVSIKNCHLGLTKPTNALAIVFMLLHALLLLFFCHSLVIT